MTFLITILLVSYCAYVFSKGSFVKVFISSHKIKYVKEEGLNTNTKLISRNIHENGVEYGLIHLEDGNSIHFWFSSHHLHKNDIGTTKFDFQNDETVYMHGFFCCSVEIPEEFLKNTETLKKFITSNSGVKP